MQVVCGRPAVRACIARRGHSRRRGRGQKAHERGQDVRQRRVVAVLLRHAHRLIQRQHGALHAAIKGSVTLAGISSPSVKMHGGQRMRERRAVCSVSPCAPLVQHPASTPTLAICPGAPLRMLPLLQPLPLQTRARRPFQLL